ncbi:hypothetical protein CBS101457_006480 [Exobasidium rhododendri]|nr:hypothetical protein CBS101457_006480 [Exobasidium rhododendri]
MSAEAAQWDLIAGEWRGEERSDSPVRLVLEGSYLDILNTSLAKRLLSPFLHALILTEYQSSTATLQAYRLQIQGGKVQPIDALAIAVASLHIFIQLNWTGPDLPEDSINPITLLRRISPDALPPRGVNQAVENSGDEDVRLGNSLTQSCLEELTWNGEPAYHLCRSPFFLLFALRLLGALPSDLVTVPWWRLRASSIHSRILDTPIMISASIFASLQTVEEHLLLLQAATLDIETKAHWGSLLARLYIDKGLTLQRSGADKEASELFVKAAAVNNFRYEVTGALGKRTKFQREEKTILVLLAESSLPDKQQQQTSTKTDSMEEEEEAAREKYDEDPAGLHSDNSGWDAGPSSIREAGMPTEMNLNDDTLLEQTRFSSTSASAGSLAHLDASNPKPLHPLDSSILLSLSLNINNAAPENGLTSSQISAFVSRTLAHARNWSVHTMGLLLRSRLEAHRTRTAQRSVLQLQALLDQMPTSDSTLSERMLYFHELDLPSTWEMQAELAKRYAALGVVRSALEIFEKIELWEEAVQCWGATGRQDRGIEVVRDLLEGRKVESSQAISERKQGGSTEVTQNLNKAREAKLWCVLGDLDIEKQEEHYLKAWIVSNQRSARAARSIGGLAFARNEFQKTILWLRRGVKINPLYTRSWFVLGCAYMRLDTTQAYLEAARCFRRCTSLDDEDGESWNNLASCYLRLSQLGQGVLREAQSSESSANEMDATEVLQGLQEDGDNEDESDRDSFHSRDSGVVMDGSDVEAEPDDLTGNDTIGSTALSSGSNSSAVFDVKLLAHRALTKSLRFSFDDWRVWNNYMIVSVDCGLMGEAVRAMTRIVDIRLAKSGTTEENKIVDVAVLNRLVDAVTRAPSKEEDAVEGASASETQQDHQIREANHSPHEGHGLYPSLSKAFESTILPRISSSAAIYRAYARLLFWQGLFRSALHAHLNAWRVSYGSDANVQVTTEKVVFVEAIEELKELCEILENFGHRQVQIDKDGKECQGKGSKVELAMDNWKFKARSLVRSFIGRTKDSFDGEKEWDDLLELRASL